jgi:hypothetical protein
MAKERSPVLLVMAAGIVPSSALQSDAASNAAELANVAATFAAALAKLNLKIHK